MKSEIGFKVLKKKGVGATQWFYHLLEKVVKHDLELHEERNTDRDPLAFFFRIRGVDASVKLPFSGENSLKDSDCNHDHS